MSLVAQPFLCAKEGTAHRVKDMPLSQESVNLIFKKELTKYKV